MRERLSRSRSLLSPTLASAAASLLLLGIACAGPGKTTEAIRCPLPNRQALSELQAACGLELEYCPQFEVWFGEILNHCQGLE